MKERESAVTTMIAAPIFTNRIASNAVTKNSPPGEQPGNTQTAFRSATQIRDYEMNTLTEKQSQVSRLDLLETDRPTCGVEGCTDTDILSTYCGSFCNEHLVGHVEECEVCAKDFA